MTFREIWQGVMTPADKLLIIVLLALSLSGYSLVKGFFPAAAGRTAVIEVKGREVRRFSLDPALPSRRIPVQIEGGEAVFDIDGGRIRVLPMPDHLCSKHICSRKGWIDRPWDMIVCLPNRIVVRVLGEKEAGDIDLISR